MGVVSCNERLLGGITPYAEAERSRIKSNKLRVLNIGHSCETSGIADERSRISTSRPRLIGFPISVNMNLQLERTVCDIWLCCGRITRRRRGYVSRVVVNM